jgi:carboxymethylenebutenolidase
MTCENVTLKGDKGTPITAYVAKPAGAGPFPGVVLIHHLPGWSELYIETTRRFAHHGYIAICANLYEREGGGSDGNPDDVAAKVRADGGIADSQMVGDTAAAVKWMRAQPNLNGKVGLFGNDDRAPSPEQVNQHEAELKKHGKNYEFHRYDGAGHGFFYWHRPLYRIDQAMDGWAKVWAFFRTHLAK